MRISPKDIFQAGNDVARPLDGFLAFAYQFQQAPLFLLGHFDQRWRMIELYYVVPVNSWTTALTHLRSPTQQRGSSSPHSKCQACRRSPRFLFAAVSGQPPALGCSENGNRVVFPYSGWVTNMNVKDLIEILRELPKGSMVVLQRNEFEALFRDSDPRRRAENIARLNGCDLTLDEESGVARFTRVEKA